MTAHFCRRAGDIKQLLYRFNIFLLILKSHIESVLGTVKSRSENRTQSSVRRFIQHEAGTLMSLVSN